VGEVEVEVALAVAEVAEVATEAAESLIPREGRSLIRGLVLLLKTYSSAAIRGLVEPVFQR
jgi:hypothetical protein